MPSFVRRSNNRRGDNDSWNNSRRGGRSKASTYRRGDEYRSSDPPYDESSRSPFGESPYGEIYVDETNYNNTAFIESDVSRLQNEVLMLKEEMQDMKLEKNDRAAVEENSRFSLSNALGSVLKPMRCGDCLTGGKQGSDAYYDDAVSYDGNREKMWHDERQPFEESREITDRYDGRGRGRSRARSRGRSRGRDDQSQTSRMRNLSRSRYSAAVPDALVDHRNDYNAERMSYRGQRSRQPEYSRRSHYDQNGDLPTVVAVKDEKNAVSVRSRRGRSRSASRRRRFPAKEEGSYRGRKTLRKQKKKNWDDESTLGTHEC